MAGQDYPEYLNPGQTHNVAVRGDFIYCKYADRPVEIAVNGQTVSMEAGDNYRPGDRFDSFTITNPGKNPISIVLTVGKGQYTRQIVQGEIKAEPVIRGADGQTRPDTRHTMVLNLVPVETPEKEISEGATLGEYRETGDVGKFLIIGEQGYPVLLNDDLGYQTHLAPDTMHTVSNTVKIERANPGSKNPDAVTYVDGVGLVFLDGDTLYVAGKGFSGEPEKLGKYPGKGDLAYDWKRHQVALIDHQNQAVTVVDANNQTVIRQGTASIGEPSEYLAYDPATDNYTLQTGSTVKLFNPETLEIKFSEFPVAEEGQPHILAGNKMFCRVQPDDVSDDAYVVRKAARDQVAPFIYRHQAAGEQLRDALTHKPRPGVTLLTANVLGDGRSDDPSVGPGIGAVFWSGEIIKAVLEVATGQAVADDYMDHVFAFHAPEEYAGEDRLNMDTGAESFARAEVKDLGAMYVPKRVRVTVDAGLSFKPRIIN